MIRKLHGFLKARPAPAECTKKADRRIGQADAFANPAEPEVRQKRKKIKNRWKLIGHDSEGCPQWLEGRNALWAKVDR